MATNVEDAAPGLAPAKPRIGAYAWYALLVVCLIVISSTSIIRILGGDSRDFRSDAQIGFP